MSVTVIYSLGDRRIVVINPSRDQHGQPILPTDLAAGIAVIADAEAAKFSNLNTGGFVLNVDGQTIDTLPVPPVPPPTPQEAEHTAAKTDLAGAYAAAVTRLGQIQSQMATIAGAGSPTNAQVIAAVQSEATAIGDLALMLQRVARLVADALT